MGTHPLAPADYDLSHLKEDVLKGVYQQLIDPKDRHDLGEYYTPDWLCERIVDELLPKHGYKAVLDPSCGSGSFLRATIHHFLNHNPDGTDNDKLRMILGKVQGIDIHPVAVTISRATYVLALGKLVNAAREPVNLPVYLADSLFLPREVEQDLYEKLSGFEITFGGKKNEKASRCRTGLSTHRSFLTTRLPPARRSPRRTRRRRETKNTKQVSDGQCSRSSNC